MKTKPFIYVDNGATSFPKPPGVPEAISAALKDVPLSPGRSSHRGSLEAARILFNARERIAGLFKCGDSSRIVFTANVTESLNVGIMGLFPHFLRQGDHIITTPFEHNSVMRPLRFLEQTADISISFLSLNEKGEVDASSLFPLQRENTRLIIANHVSNVTGAVAPIEEIGAAKGNALFMVDAAQSAGVLPLDVEAMNIDFLAFTGHKALLGPTGTGGFYIRAGVDVKPLKRGGTGSRSEEEFQPGFSPDRYESGTPNTSGIAGLDGGVRFIMETGLETIYSHEFKLTGKFLKGLASIAGIRLFGPPADTQRAAVISLQVDGKSESQVAQILDREYGIQVRAGLHCSPATHKAIGTFPQGTVRFSFGYFNTEDDVNRCLQALSGIAAR